MPRPLPAILDPSQAISEAVTGRPTREWYRFFFDLLSALANRLPVVGSVTFAASTTVAVTFSKPEADANYTVWAAAPDNKTYWASSLTANGFTMNASSASSATVPYQLIRS